MTMRSLPVYHQWQLSSDKGWGTVLHDEASDDDDYTACTQ